MIIETNPVLLQSEKPIVLTFLSDFTNYEELMPEQVSKWSADADHCEFTIQGMPGIGMAFKEKTDHGIIIGPHGKVPFDFSINVKCDQQDSELQLTLEFSAEVNAFYKMMLERPLTNFLQGISDKLGQRTW